MSNLILFWSRNQSIKILCKNLEKKSIDQTLVHSLSQSSQFTKKNYSIRIKTVWKTLNPVRIQTKIANIAPKNHKKIIHKKAWESVAWKSESGI